MNKIKIVSLALVVFAFIGCGGGGSGEETSSTSLSDETTVQKVETKRTVDNTNEIKIPLLKGVESTPTDSL